MFGKGTMRVVDGQRQLPFESLAKGMPTTIGRLMHSATAEQLRRAVIVMRVSRDFQLGHRITLQTVGVENQTISGQS